MCAHIHVLLLCGALHAHVNCICSALQSPFSCSCTDSSGARSLTLLLLLLLHTNTQTQTYNTTAVLLAPYSSTPEERTRILEGLVHSLVKAGVVPEASVRHELQDVRCMARMGLQEPALAKLERAAMIYFGESYCVCYQHNYYCTGADSVAVDSGSGLSVNII
jgi:Domain of unknown function (DUF4743)